MKIGSIGPTTINTAVAMVLSICAIGLLVCMFVTVHQLQEDIVCLRLREHYNMATIRRLYGVEAPEVEAWQLKAFKASLGSDGPFAGQFRALEDKQALLFEGKRLKAPGLEFHYFEQQSRALTNAITAQALERTCRINMLSVAAATACLLLSSVMLLSGVRGKREKPGHLTSRADSRQESVALSTRAIGKDPQDQEVLEGIGETAPKDEVALASKSSAIEDLQWRDIFNSLPVGIVTADEHGVVQSISNEALRILRYSGDDVTGRLTITQLLGNSELSGLLERSMGQPLHLTAVNGKDVSVALRTVRYSAASGKTGYLLSLLDVSKKVELDKLKAQFIAMVGHDLRAPLTSINGFLSMLLDQEYGEIPGEAQEILQIVSGDVLRVLRICNGLLDIQRLESSDYSIVLTDVAVAHVFLQAVRSLGAHIHEKSLVVERYSGDAQVRANEELLLQVVINLLSNAINFSPANSTIRLDAEVFDSTVAVRVIDEGPGLEPGAAEKIFQPGTRSKLSSAESAGFGLSLVRLVAEKHKGTVYYRANHPSGSIFTVELPA